MWLEKVSSELLKSRALKLERRNYAYIREAIFQLNKDKFKINEWRSNEKTMILNVTSSLKIPKEWYK